MKESALKKLRLFNMKESIFQAWKDSGLLDGLSNDDALIFVVECEIAANYIINNSFINEDLSTFCFPIMRRVFMKIGRFDTLDLISELQEFYDNKFDYYKNVIGGMNALDYEAQMCLDFSETYANNLKARIIKKRFEQE